MQSLYISFLSRTFARKPLTIYSLIQKRPQSDALRQKRPAIISHGLGEKQKCEKQIDSVK